MDSKNGNELMINNNINFIKLLFFNYLLLFYPYKITCIYSDNFIMEQS